MAITPVQQNVAAIAGSSPVTSGTITLGAGATLGNLLVVCIAIGDDSLGLAGPTADWHLAGTPSGQAYGVETAILYCVVGAADAGDTSWVISWTDVAAWVMTIREWSSDSGWPAAPLDLPQNWSNGYGHDIQTGTTASTTQADELWVAGFGYNNSPGLVESNLTNGFTNGQQATSATVAAEPLTLREAYKIVSAEAAASSQLTIATDKTLSGAIATFKKGTAVAVPDNMAVTAYANL